MRTLFLIAGLATAPTALAMDIGGTASLELGTIANHDPAWNVFSNADGMPSRGLRGGVRLGEHVAVQAGWHRVRRGSDTTVQVAANGGFEQSTIRSAFFADEFSLGAQVGLPLAKLIFPYASVDGMLFRGVMKIDEDPETRQNTNQVRGQGLTQGVMTMGGLELRTPEAPVGWQLAAFVEVGHSWFLRQDFGELGEMTPGGLSVRGGAGIRF